MIATSELEAWIEEQYALAHVRVERELPTKGSRAVLVLTTDSGRFVAKLTAPGQPAERVRRDVETLTYLERFQFPSLSIRRTGSGQLYGAFGDRLVYLYRFVNGRLPRASASFHQLLGRLLARLHSLPSDDFPFVTPYGPAAHLPAIAHDLEARSAAGEVPAPDLLALARDLGSFEGLPRSLIHTDPYFSNILVDESGGLILVDWDDAGIGIPLLDVGYVIAHLCTFLPGDRARWDVEGSEEIVWRADWAHLFLEAYGTVRPLSAAERQMLESATIFSLLEYIVHPVTGSILLPNYRRILLLKEQREFWERVAH